MQGDASPLVGNVDGQPLPPYTYPADYKGDYVVCAGASVSASVTFEEGCVVLPGARILVEGPPTALPRLLFGPYCLVEEYACIRVCCGPPTHEAENGAVHTPAELRIASFCHFQSRSSITLHIPSAASEKEGSESASTFMIGSGTVFHPFSSLVVIIDAGVEANREHTAPLIGSHVVFTPYASVRHHFSAESRLCPVVGDRQVVVLCDDARASDSASVAVVSRGGVRSVAEIGSVVDHLDREQEDGDGVPVRTPPRRAQSSCAPSRVMDRCHEDHDDGVDGDVKQRCRYYLALF